MDFEGLDRITVKPGLMGGKPTIRGMRVTVGMVLEELANGTTSEQLLEAFPYLEMEDIAQALRYGAWLARGHEADISSA